MDYDHRGVAYLLEYTHFRGSTKLTRRAMRFQHKRSKERLNPFNSICSGDGGRRSQSFCSTEWRDRTNQFDTRVIALAEIHKQKTSESKVSPHT